MTHKLTLLEKLTEECEKSEINIENQALPKNINAVFYEDKETEPVITINKALKTQSGQACVLAEELGHYYTSCGDLLTDTSIDKIVINQQENRAKRWAVKKLISIKRIIKAFESGVSNMSEMADYLDITESFLIDAFETYNAMYGKCKRRGNYTIFFDPPGIIKTINERG